jgi:hypothetical protein
LSLSIRNTILNLKNRWNFFIADKYLRTLGFTDLSADLHDKSILFTFDQDRVAILNMDYDMLGYSIEATVVLPAHILSLKTMSDLCNIIFTYCCAGSGIRPAGDDSIRLNVSYHIGETLSLGGIKLGIQYLCKCLATLELYLVQRNKNIDKEIYDLSMFEHIDLTGFNPQDMGEQKEFIFGSWEAYSKSVRTEYDDFPNHPYAVDVLSKISACQIFEEKNGIPISEIGTWLVDDIILYRQMIETSKTSFGIN